MADLFSVCFPRDTIAPGPIVPETFVQATYCSVTYLFEHDDESVIIFTSRSI